MFQIVNIEFSIFTIYLYGRIEFKVHETKLSGDFFFMKVMNRKSRREDLLGDLILKD